MHRLKLLFAVTALFAVIALIPAAQASDQDFNGRWDIQVHAAPAAFANFTTTAAWWLQVTGAGTPELKIQFVGAPDGGVDDLSIAKIQNGVLHFTWVEKPRSGRTPNPNDHAEYTVKYVNGLLQGTMTSPSTNPATTLTFTGHRAPKIDEHDDGTWVQGKSIQLFDGKDLKGWTGVNSPKAAGWSVEDGLLKCAGSADDLITVRKFWNFDLHAEYKLGERSNSGIGLRGRYEVQIMSNYGLAPTIHGTGSLVGRIPAAVNASKPAGEWNAYDIRMVGLEVTTVMNGQTLYKNGVIAGLTGIAMNSFEGQPGPIELQGDHGAVQYRNIVLTPLVRRNGKSAKTK